MATRMLTGGIWTKLKRELARSADPAHVAVAYFGKGAAELLNLRRGSQLVVDASEHAVKSGQTCPDDLLILFKKGVRVFSVANLHAKTYVFGRTALVGSANTSRHSAATLIEAMVITNNTETVRKARQFVQSMCKTVFELGPKQLENLQKIYRPPRLAFRTSPTHGRHRPLHAHGRQPAFHLVQLERVDTSDRDDVEHNAGYKIARERREHQRSWGQDDFRWDGSHGFRKYDKLAMVTDEGDGTVLIDAPGTVFHVHNYRDGHLRKAWVFVELPKRRRRRIQNVAKRLGCATKRLRRNGALRRDLTAAFENLW